MDEKMFNLLITTEDQNDFLAIIDQLLSIVYTNSDSLLTFLHAEVPELFSKIFLNEFQTNQDPQSKEKWLHELRNQVVQFEKIALTLAFHPTRNALERMISIIRKQYGFNILMEIHYNPELIAGAEIIYRGIYHDVSSRAKFNEVLSSMKGKMS
jgi:hypothetical protein